MIEVYENQVDLLLDVLPVALKDSRFALKGGTAINLFYREMPRLSVDIDICYLPIEDRQTSFRNMHSILQKTKDDLEDMGLEVKSSKPLNAKSEVKLFVSNGEAVIKVEPNFTLRGAVFDAEIKPIKNTVIQKFRKEIEVNCLSLADVFGGKICAALDRQHPRDLFDIKLFMENEVLNEELKKSFLVHLISHPRPINEILNPNIKDLSSSFESEFKGMTILNVTHKELIKARKALINWVQTGLSKDDKDFLISFKNLEPKWELLGIDKIQSLPAVKWKLINLSKMEENKRISQLDRLKYILYK